MVQPIRTELPDLLSPQFIAINILLTLMITYRLVTARNQLRQALGREHAQDYTSLIAITIESASIYSTVSLIYIIAFARQSDIQNLCLPPLAQLMVRLISYFLPLFVFSVCVFPAKMIVVF